MFGGLKPGHFLAAASLLAAPIVLVGSFWLLVRDERNLRGTLEGTAFTSPFSGRSVCKAQLVVEYRRFFKDSSDPHRSWRRRTAPAVFAPDAALVVDGRSFPIAGATKKTSGESLLLYRGSQHTEHTLDVPEAWFRHDATLDRYLYVLVHRHLLQLGEDGIPYELRATNASGIGVEDSITPCGQSISLRGDLVDGVAVLY